MGGLIATVVVLGIALVATMAFLRPRAGEPQSGSRTTGTLDGGPDGIARPTTVPLWARQAADAGNGGGVDPGSWMPFMLRGREKGFRIAELQKLYRASRAMGQAIPDVVFSSGKALDDALRWMLWQNLSSGGLGRRDVDDDLFRLLRYRQGLEIGRHKARGGLTSTRAIEAGQSLRIMVAHVGLFQSRVLAVTRSHLEIELPKGKPVSGAFSWKGKPVEVYFRRRDDAGYFFETKVQNAPAHTLEPTLLMSHADQIIRTQKRASIRAKVEQDGWLSPLRSPADANEKYVEGQGYLCRILDLSDSGVAVIVRGHLDAGFFVKVQTVLSGFPIVICGEIKAVSVQRTQGVSVLHLQAIPSSKTMHVRILSWVLGIIRD